MRHQQVIDNFITKGHGGLGTYVRANEDLLYSRIPKRYRPYGRRPWDTPVGQTTPLAVRLATGDLLANGAALSQPMDWHQTQVLSALGQSSGRFGVVPFHSIVAAWTRGKVRE